MQLAILYSQAPINEAHEACPYSLTDNRTEDHSPVQTISSDIL